MTAIERESETKDGGTLMLKEMKMRSIKNVLPISLCLIAIGIFGLYFCRIEDDVVGQYVMTGFFGLSCALGVFFPCKAVAGGFQKDLIKKLKAEGGSALKIAEDDYQIAKEICAGVKAGHIYLFSTRNARSQALRLDQIAWAYTYRKETRKKGAVTVTYMVKICMVNQEKEEIDSKDEAMCHLILDYLQQTLPGVFIGYSEGLENLYNNQHNEFMRMRREKEAKAAGNGQ